MANETKIERGERFCVAFEYKKAATTLEVLISSFHGSAPARFVLLEAAHS